MTDIVERLRGEILEEPWDETATSGLMGEAADEIGFLRRENERLRLREQITIERCAEELEAAYSQCSTLNLLHGAARLRALKDKP